MNIMLLSKKIWLTCMLLLGLRLWAEAQVVTNFTLVNADNEQDIGLLTNGGLINLATLPTNNLNIRVNTNPAVVGSVSINLNNGSILRIENAAPYALEGDDNGNYRPWIPALGAYNLKARAYSQGQALGQAGPEVSINFTVIRENPPLPPANLLANALNSGSIQLSWEDKSANETNFLVEFASSANGNFTQLASLGANTTQFTHTGLNPGQSVWYRVKAKGTNLESAYTNTATATTPNASNQLSVTSLTLINADNNQPITQLTEGLQLDVSGLPSTNLSIHALTNGGESVRMILSGALSHNQVESLEPYALFGDDPNANGGRNFIGRTFSLGNYTISVTPYALNSATGDPGTTLNINFSLINPSPITYSLSLSNDGKGTAAANPQGPYAPNTSVTATATPNTGNQFVNWTNTAGIVVSTTNPYTFAINANTSLKANFQAIPPATYTLTLTNDGKGTASVNPAGPYTAGTSITLTATPNTGYQFANWTNNNGSLISTANPYTFAINSNQSLKANFNAIPAGPAVVSFTLINALNDQDILTIPNGGTIDLTTLATNQLNIRANTSGTIGSIAFQLTGALVRTQTESGAPYALYGDNAGDYYAQAFVAGAYTLTATPYSLAGAQGSTGTPLIVSFTMSHGGGPVIVNNPPVISNPGNQTNAEGNIVNLPISANDGDTDQTQSLTYSASGLPLGLSINPTTGVISGTVLEPSTGTDNGAFVENNGLVIMEVESAAIKSGWIKKADGSINYYEATVDNFNSVNANTTLDYSIQINNPGIYRIVWRSRINAGNSATDHNDNWMKLHNNADATFFAFKGTPANEAALQTALNNKTVLYPGGSGLTPNPAGISVSGYFKIYMNTLNTWIWRSVTSDNDPHDIYVKFDKAGTYTLQIGNRSAGHAIDKLALYRVNNYGYNYNNNLDLLAALAESQRGGAGSPGAAANSPYNTTITVTDNGNPPKSSTINFTWFITDANSVSLTSPSNLTAQALATDQVRITWQDNSGNENNFILETSGSTSGPFTELAVLPSNTTQYTHRGLAPGQKVVYRVKARNATQESAYSNVYQVQSFPSPLAPQNLSTSQITNNSLLLSWTPSAFGEVYVIEQSTQANTGFSKVATVNWGTNQTQINGLTANTIYYFRASTEYKGLSSAASNTATATTGSGSGTTQQVVSLTLINADTDAEIGLLQEGDTINLAVLGTSNLSVRANTNPATVGSVGFTYDNIENFQIENTAPYTIRGDAGSDYYPWVPTLGLHKLVVTPYSASAAGGTAGTALAVNFTVINQSGNTDPQPNEPPVLSGEFKKWHKLTISFFGPQSSEQDADNPFLHYRLNVTFRNGNKTYVVPGYYAADGQAGETSASSGNVWKVHFSPDEIGEWSFSASFRKGNNIAIDENPNAGQALDFDGQSGTFIINPSDKIGKDLRARGRLNYVNGHYLQFKDSGEYFLKGGADSPENFLAYREFDGTYTHGTTDYTKTYSAHLQDWNSESPTWKGGKGKGIIGALNYLASEGMNSVYFLTMNVNGDGKDVWPWTSHTERYRFDVSKLDQWEMVFSHMDQLGIMMHILTQETENDLLLDGGYLGTQRKLYYRELIARFSHHLAINWNLGEENDIYQALPDPNNAQLKNYSSYFKRIDPYKSYVNVHTYPGQQNNVYEDLLGYADFNGASLQIGNTSGVHNEVIKWVNLSAQSGLKWVVNLDEIGPANNGVVPDANDFWHDAVRKQALWGTLMGGGGGVEWYFGYSFPNSDLTCQDWRSRDNLWNLTRYALEFFQTYLPFWEMSSQDALTSATNDYCFAKPGEAYLVYLPDGGSTNLNFGSNTGDYTVMWFNPRSGETWQDKNMTVSTTQNIIKVGPPPSSITSDWAVLIRKNDFVVANTSVSSTVQDVSQAVFPNPSSYHTNFIVKPVQSGDVRITITSMEAVVMDKIIIDVPAGEQTITLQTHGVPDGAYTYQVSYPGLDGTVTESGRLFILH
ncbi:MAG: DUF5060 domain-containing protein [Microscillaceae bacterium]|nr:DUF5060 domain-containing protein [Microscillaceae bacterium]